MKLIKKYTVLGTYSYHKYVKTKNKFIETQISMDELYGDRNFYNTIDECKEIIADKIKNLNNPNLPSICTPIDDHSYLIEWADSKNFRVATFNIIEVTDIEK